ncbi:MAG: hypothetical protein UHH87_01750 [Akkermansia sp.]|nr:hypothetical protein [Akkermansia sp.]
MRKVEIDVTANTSQAEHAMVALTGDVDNLLSRARKLQDRRERDRKEERIDLREQGRYQRKPSVDVKVINNNTTELGNSLENLTNLFELFADKIGGSFSDFYAKMQMIGAAFAKLKYNIIGFAVPLGLKGDPESIEKAIAASIKGKIADTKFEREVFHATPGAARILARDAINSRMASAMNRGWARVDNGWEMAPGGGFRRSYRLIPREELKDKYGKLIPESQPGSARFNRGLAQLRYGNEVPTGGLGRLALSGGRLAGLGNIALGGGRMALSALG